jgi:hypothetical protein
MKMKQVNSHGGGMEEDDTALGNLGQQNIALHVAMEQILSFRFQYQEGDHPVLHDVIDWHNRCHQRNCHLLNAIADVKDTQVAVCPYTWWIKIDDCQMREVREVGIIKADILKLGAVVGFKNWIEEKERLIAILRTDSEQLGRMDDYEWYYNERKGADRHNRRDILDEIAEYKGTWFEEYVGEDEPSIFVEENGFGAEFQGIELDRDNDFEGLSVRNEGTFLIKFYDELPDSAIQTKKSGRALE